MRDTAGRGAEVRARWADWWAGWAADPARVRAAGVEVARAVAGRLLGALGSAVAMRSGLGTGPWDTLYSAAHVTTGAGYGALTTAGAAALLVLGRAHGGRPHAAMVVHALAGGLLVEWVLGYLPHAAAPAAGWAYLVAALALNVLAGALVLGAPIARTAYDGALVAVSARRGWSAGRARLCLDLPALAAGWALGGRVGAGTVAGALLTGPLIQAVLRARAAGARRPRPAAPELRLTPFEPARAVA